MKKIILTIPLLWITAVCFAQTTSVDNGKITLSDIESVFGPGFKAESPVSFGMTESIRFSGKEFSIDINISPGYGMTLDDYNKMMSPKTVVWTAIPNDPDGAKIEVRPDGEDDLSSIPAIAYIRNDKYVRIQIMGNYYGFDIKQMPAAREEMRKKLALLKRIP